MMEAQHQALAAALPAAAAPPPPPALPVAPFVPQLQGPQCKEVRAAAKEPEERRYQGSQEVR